MIEVEIKPYKKVVIHEILESEYNNFVNLVTLNPYDLRWVNGILFFFFSSKDSDFVLAEKQRGIRHWDLFHFTRMDNFQMIVKNSISNVQVPVIDNSSSKFVSEAIESLLKQLKE